MSTVPNSSVLTSVSPQAADAPRNIVLMIASWTLVLLLAAFSLVAAFVTNQFLEVFTSFGAELPGITLFFIAARYWWWLSAVFALIPALAVSLRRRHPVGYQFRIAVTLIAMFITALCIFFTGVFAMYLPIFKLGQVV